jgi:hypothetical protein
MDRKLTLNVDALTVTAFETEGQPLEIRGPVKAREEGPGCPWSQPFSCPATVHSCTD